MVTKAGNDVEQRMPERAGKLLVIAHRGASAYAPENTVTAFVLAVEMGAQMIELDVRLSADGQLVVSHDPDLARTTDGSGYVHEHTLARLKQLDAGYRFSSNGGASFPFRGLGVRICTLAEAYDAIPGRVGLNVEIKHLPTDPDFDVERERAAGALTNFLARRPELVARTLVSSFNHRAIEAVRAAGLGLRTGYLVPPGVPLERAIDYAAARGHEALHPHESTLAGDDAGRWVAAAHAAGLRVNVWTVDDEPRMRELIAAGVDGIISNRPDILARAARSGRP